MYIYFKKLISIIKTYLLIKKLKYNKKSIYKTTNIF